MSDAVSISLITGVVSVSSLLINVLIKNKVTKLSKDVDGHMTKLLALTKKEGKDEQKEIDKKT